MNKKFFDHLVKMDKPGAGVVVAGLARKSSERRTGDENKQAATVFGNEFERKIATWAVESGMYKDASEIHPAQLKAGAMAMALARDPMGSLMMSPDAPISDAHNTVIGNFTKVQRKAATENFDESGNQHVVEFSTGLNFAVARPSAVSGLFYPPVILSPDEPAYRMTCNLMMLQQTVSRDNSGDPTDWGRVNLLRAARDPSMLLNDMLDIVPVVADNSEKYFVDTTVVAPTDQLVGGEAVQTSYLKTGEEVDLLGLSQTATMLAKGMVNETDSVHPAMNAAHLLLKVGNDYININASTMPGAAFAAAPQDDTRDMLLIMRPNGIIVNERTTQWNGAALTSLAVVATKKLMVQYSLYVHGVSNLRNSHTSMYHGNVKLARVLDENGNPLPLTTGDGKAIADLFATAKIVGYKISAKRANLNHAVLGTLLDTQEYREMYPTTIHSPLSVRRPIDRVVDEFDILKTLTTGVTLGMKGKAIGHLLETATLLESYCDGRTHDEDATDRPSILGSGRWFVKPTFINFDLDMEDYVQPDDNAGRLNNIRSAMMNVMNDITLRLSRDSEYSAVFERYYEGSGVKKRAIVATSERIGSYLMETGDARTLGPYMDYEVAYDNDYRMDNVMIISFGVADAQKLAVPHVMQYGFMTLTPEVTSAAQITRDNRTTKEVMVTPNYKHWAALPIMARVTVRNLEKVLGRLTQNINIVDSVTIPTAP